VVAVLQPTATITTKKTMPKLTPRIPSQRADVTPLMVSHDEVFVEDAERRALSARG
jgi:hypothetical protein